MKRFLCVLMVAALLAALVPMNCLALEVEEETVTARFDDGSYITESIQVYHTRASGTVTGSKVKTYYGENGVAEWKAVLTGTFTYTGTSSTCTNASCTVTIYESAWYTISKSASKSGNTAYGSVTMGYKLLGVTIKEVPANLSLKCDENGNLS